MHGDLVIRGQPDLHNFTVASGSQASKLAVRNYDFCISRSCHFLQLMIDRK